MFKVYKKADILEKISDKVKTVDDLYHLPRDLFDRELFDSWYSIYLDYYQDRGYDDFDWDLRDIRIFYYAFYLIECHDCCNLVLNSLGVENALYTLYKVDEHLSILLTRKGSRNRQITLFISQRCIISIAKQICFVNTTYGSKT